MKPTNNNIAEKRSYGTLSMVAIIVGMVIGSGIFIKNQDLMETTNSVILTTIGWIIGGLVVLSMMLAFIEISSITKIKKEQGTFKNWSKHLFNEKTARYVGVYFTFIYFPLVLAAESIFASNQLMQIGFISDHLINNQGSLWLLITTITVLIVLAAFFVNSLWVKPGKTFNSIGSIVKLIPLFLVIITGILLVAGVTINGNNDYNEIFNPDDPTNSGLDENSSNIGALLAILPGVLFAFDGFLYANSMSNETKTPGTFKRAVVIAVVFITLTYILFSITSMLIAPVDEGLDNPYEISTILTYIFGEVMGNILVFIIFISITSATFGYAVSTMWALADYSDTNEIRDMEGKLIRRNKVGNPEGAGMRMLLYALIAIAAIRFMDLVALGSFSLSGDDLTAGNYSATIMADYTSDVFTVFNFGFYAFIIFGGLMNRVNKKNEVEKIKGFWFFGILTLIIMTGVVGYMAYDIVVKSIFIPIFNSSTSDEIIESVCKLVVVIAMVTTFLSLSYFIDKNVKDAEPSVWAYKRIFRKAYELHIPYSQYSSSIPEDVHADYKDAYKKLEELSGQKIHKSNITRTFLEHPEDESLDHLKKNKPPDKTKSPTKSKPTTKNKDKPKPKSSAKKTTKPNSDKKEVVKKQVNKTTSSKNTSSSTNKSKDNKS